MEVYWVIDELVKDQYSVLAVCEALGLTRSRYYTYRRGRMTRRQRDDNRLRPKVRTVFDAHKRRYGARRIAAELRAQGAPCSPRRVGRIMQEIGLKALQPKSFKPRTTQSEHRLGYSPNLLLGADPPTSVNQVWVGDITFIPLSGGLFSYLAVLMDLYSRRIVGWMLDRNMDSFLVLATLRKAIRNRRPRPGLIHHTDRGGQYRWSEYRELLAAAGMLQSMSRADDCYDNAFMESCFGKVKTELSMKAYANHRIALGEIETYMRYYNTRRRHSSLGNVTPEAFEQFEREAK